MAITDNATHALLIDEVFGPVLSVQSFHNDNEAFALADDTRSALAGTVWINEHLAIGSEMPHGGVKGSGFGKDMRKDWYDAVSSR